MGKKDTNSSDSRYDYSDICGPGNIDKPLNYNGTPGTLYDPYHGPDNFTHAGLFAGLRTNPYPCQLTVYDTILKSGRCINQFAAASVFHVIYYHFVNGQIEPNTILNYSIVSSITAYCLGNIFVGLISQQPVLFMHHFRKEHIRLSAIFVIFSYQLAPVLRSLTTEISLNTIQYIAGISTLLHLSTSFYGIESFMTSNAISVNSAIIGSICLTSRLDSDYHCFALLVLSVQIFILFPIFASLFWDSLSAITMCAVVACIVTYTVSLRTLALFISCLFIGLGITPPLLVYGLKFKNNIYGPWDEAVIQPYAKPSRVPDHDPYR